MGHPFVGWNPTPDGEAVMDGARGTRLVIRVLLIEVQGRS